MDFILCFVSGLLIVTAVSGAAIFLFLKHPKFGRLPSGKRLQRVLRSPNYHKNSFKNLSETPQLSENARMYEIIFRFLFHKSINLRPRQKFNFTKSDLSALRPDENVYIWMGHSSYFIQLDGKKILVDPVFSGSASPLSFNIKSFAGTDLYTVADLPEIDYLIITHDHWDHLDYKTVKEINFKVKKVITGLGTGEHLEYWKYDPKNIIELDWGESFDLGQGYKVYAESARHFSGRTFKKNKAIWASFVFETPRRRIYIGGDSGFDNHFKKIGDHYGGFDLAILENGQYNKDWPYIHMMPQEFLIAAKDLKAKTIIPVHNSKFALALHGWKDPLQDITQLNATEGLHLITPKIGEKVAWENETGISDRWWEFYN